MRQVAALFVRADSVYRGMAGVDCYDIERDARTWPGGSPVEREETPPLLAEWLIELARRTRVPAAREAMAA